MKKWSILVILAVAEFVMVLDSTVMNVSISKVVTDLDTTVNAMQAAITFYSLILASFMLIGAKLCAKWGLLRAFIVGSFIFGLGAFITSVSPNIQTLILGWSFIEALGAVLVVPAVASLVATHFTGRDRVTAYGIIGGVAGAAAAAGPLIGGFMTTYLSWRYVFAAEAVIMVFVLLASRLFKTQPKPAKIKVDITSAVLSAAGMCILVFGMLQSKIWGWVTPIIKPVIAGHQIAPFGISLVAYLLLVGAIILYVFYRRQKRLEKSEGSPLIEVSMFKIKQLRAGLSVLMAQYLIIGAVFFIVPVYLQMVLGFDALSTGVKILPLSAALILFSLVGTKLINRFTPRFIVRFGQILMVVGIIFLLMAVNRDLTGLQFGLAMFLTGAGLGLLASQLGNINMSAVEVSKSSEVGGLQGTFQNFGSSLGTALIGSVLIASLTAGFLTNVATSSLPQSVKQYVAKTEKTVQIVPASVVQQAAIKTGSNTQQAAEISNIYKDSQLQGLKSALFYLIIIAVFSLFLSRSIPNTLIKR